MDMQNRSQPTYINCNILASTRIQNFEKLRNGNYA